METIESRLACIERQLRLHRAMTAGLLVALIALVGYGATEGVPEEIRARKLIVINAAGQEVAKLESGEFGGNLIVRNSAGQPKILMSPLPLGAGLIALLDDSGTPRIRLSVDPTGRTSGLTFSDENHNILLSIMSGLGGKSYLHVRGGGEFSIFNDNGKEVVRAFSDEKGDGAVVVGNRSGRSRTLTPR